MPLLYHALGCIWLYCCLWWIIYKEGPQMIDCQKLTFSNELSQQRINQFKTILGGKIINKIICFALFLLGVDRKTISEAINIPGGTIRSVIRAIRINGITGFEDRRKKCSSFLSPPKSIEPEVSVSLEEENIIVNLGLSNQKLQVSRKNHLQAKNFLLTMLNNGLISVQKIATVLHLTPAHIYNLSKKLQEQDVQGLIDKRQGQKKDYKFSSEVKTEIVQQFAANAIIGESTSSRTIAKQLKHRCNLNLPDRSIRLHIEKIGLGRITKSLPGLVDSLKKTKHNGNKYDK